MKKQRQSTGMEPRNFELSSKLISSRYIIQAQQARTQRESLLRGLLSQRRLPEDGWDDHTIELVLQEFSGMDSNNFVNNVIHVFCESN